MNDDKIRTGLWKKDGDRGSYYSGKVEVGGVTYWVNLYKNDRKESDKHPDLNLMLKPAEPAKAATGGYQPQGYGKPAPESDFPF